MDRRQELIELINEENLLIPLVDQIVLLEKQLDEVNKLPFYKVHPTNPQLQKMLPAFRIYKELLQQYTNCIKTLARSVGMDEKDEESPLRKWVNSRLEGD